MLTNSEQQAKNHYLNLNYNQLETQLFKISSDLIQDIKNIRKVHDQVEYQIQQVYPNVSYFDMNINPKEWLLNSKLEKIKFNKFLQKYFHVQQDLYEYFQDETQDAYLLEPLIMTAILSEGTPQMKAILIFEMLQHFENTFTESSSYISTQTALSFLQWFYFTFFGSVCGKFVIDIFLSLLDQDHIGSFRSAKFTEDNISVISNVTTLLREYIFTNFFVTGGRTLYLPQEWIIKYFQQHNIPFTMEKLNLYVKGNQYFKFNFCDDDLKFPQLIYSYNPFNKISKSEFIDAFLELPGAIKCLTQKNIVTVDENLEFQMDIYGIIFKVSISNQDNKTIAASTIVNEHKKVVKKYGQVKFTSDTNKGGVKLENDLRIYVDEAQLQMNLLMLLFQIETQLINRLTDLGTAGKLDEKLLNLNFVDSCFEFVNNTDNYRFANELLDQLTLQDILIYTDKHGAQEISIKYSPKNDVDESDRHIRTESLNSTYSSISKLKYVDNFKQWSRCRIATKINSQDEKTSKLGIIYPKFQGFIVYQAEENVIQLENQLNDPNVKVKPRAEKPWK